MLPVAAGGGKGAILCFFSAHSTGAEFYLKPEY